MVEDIFFFSQNLLKPGNGLYDLASQYSIVIGYLASLQILPELPKRAFLFPEYSLYIAMIFITNHQKSKDYHLTR